MKQTSRLDQFGVGVLLSFSQLAKKSLISLIKLGDCVLFVSLSRDLKSIVWLWLCDCCDKKCPSMFKMLQDNFGYRLSWFASSLMSIENVNLSCNTSFKYYDFNLIFFCTSVCLIIPGVVCFCCQVYSQCFSATTENGTKN